MEQQGVRPSSPNVYRFSPRVLQATAIVLTIASIATAALAFYVRSLMVAATALGMLALVVWLNRPAPTPKPEEVPPPERLASPPPISRPSSPELTPESGVSEAPLDPLPSSQPGPPTPPVLPGSAAPTSDSGIPKAPLVLESQPNSPPPNEAATAPKPNIPPAPPVPESTVPAPPTQQQEAPSLTNPQPRTTTAVFLKELKMRVAALNAPKEVSTGQPVDPRVKLPGRLKITKPIGIMSHAEALAAAVAQFRKKDSSIPPGLPRRLEFDDAGPPAAADSKEAILDTALGGAITARMEDAETAPQLSRMRRANSSPNLKLSMEQQSAGDRGSSPSATSSPQREIHRLSSTPNLASSASPQQIQLNTTTPPSLQEALIRKLAEIRRAVRSSASPQHANLQQRLKWQKPVPSEIRGSEAGTTLRMKQRQAAVTSVEEESPRPEIDPHSDAIRDRVLADIRNSMAALGVDIALIPHHRHGLSSLLSAQKPQALPLPPEESKKGK